MQSENSLIVDGAMLTCAAVAAVARRGAPVAVAPSGLARALASHRAALALAHQDLTALLDAEPPAFTEPAR